MKNIKIKYSEITALLESDGIISNEKNKSDILHSFFFNFVKISNLLASTYRSLTLQKNEVFHQEFHQ